MFLFNQIEPETNFVLTLIVIVTIERILIEIGKNVTSVLHCSNTTLVFDLEYGLAILRLKCVSFRFIPRCWRRILHVKIRGQIRDLLGLDRI